MEATVIAFSGDALFIFSVPGSVHWMERKYETPFLQIVLSNGGWKSPKPSTLAVHLSGYGAAGDDIDVVCEPAPDYVGMAAANGERGAVASNCRAKSTMQSPEH